MEIANDQSGTLSFTNRARVAQKNDSLAISKLMQSAPYTHFHADWHYPADWLGSDGFAVVEAETPEAGSLTMADRFFGQVPLLSACMAAAADPPPAAWVRVAAVSEKVDGLDALMAMNTIIDQSLLRSGVDQIGWLQIDPWPQSWIRAAGFDQEDFMETFIKEGTQIPLKIKKDRLDIRPVRSNDLETLSQIEKMAYEPLWRNSAAGLILARRHAYSFDVVEYHGQIVGYQYSTMMVKKAHLSRITIHPQWQGKGIGSALLAHAIEGYREYGVQRVSLNTQISNDQSKRLYEKFGFQPTGERFSIWTKELR